MNLTAQKNIKVILYSDASEIMMADLAANNVVNVLAKSIVGNQFYVGAKYFVIACGAIENARLLLMSNRQRVSGIGIIAILLVGSFKNIFGTQVATLCRMPGIPNSDSIYGNGRMATLVCGRI